MNITVKDIIKNERDNGHTQQKVIGLFTHSRVKAENKLREMSEYYEGMVEKLFISVAQQSLILSNGTIIKWIKPTNSQRGHRCHGAIIDERIDHVTRHEIIEPMLLPCCNEENVTEF